MTAKRVLIVDDSAVVRQVLKEIIDADPGFEVMAAVADPLFALRRMEKEWPDIITLDVEMPRMDGITFLKKIMAERPTPIVMCSTLTEKGTDTCMQALAAGAVEIVEKPKAGGSQRLSECSQLILHALKSAAVARIGLRKANAKAAGDVTAPRQTRSRDLAKTHVSLTPGTESVAMVKTTERVIAIGTSTGGTQALERMLSELPPTVHGMVVVQHMPEKFTAAFARRLDSICALSVKEAADGDRVMPGQVLIAPGGKHMLLKRNGAQYQIEIRDGPLVSRHRPSVDVLFRSVARYAGKNAMGIIMTGMGSDGAAGLLEMKQAGARTLAQDEQSCVVFGMPKEAIKKGGVEETVSLESLPELIMQYSEQVSPNASKNQNLIANRGLKRF
ncbi:MAG: chemotaxis response regulator protein-glutamate methylesterase [Pseudomonadales bacterium]|nr:chemotaxis response regulator protein-glutamate methylesterase [Pseudomonadales bacterium]